jgi:hypothetical protein
MWIRNLVNALKPWYSRRSVQSARPRNACRRSTVSPLAIEALEDRSVPATLSVWSNWVLEGVSGIHNAELEVRLSAPSTKTVTVDYVTRNDPGIGTATAGSDYEPVSGRLTFARGETSKTILIPIHGDRKVEPNEWFEVQLQRPKGATIAGSWSAKMTIIDSSPRISISDERVIATAGSGSTLMTFTVRLSAAYDLPVTVNYATSDGFEDENTPLAAYAGQDYVATSGTLTFAPGETTKTISVEILGDAVPESDEYFFVDLFSPSNAYLNGGVGLGFISSQR